METRHGVCNLCEATCGLLFTLDGTRIVSVRGNPRDPLSRGHICPKALALEDVYEDPDRLRRPVRRTPQGWVEISWEEAFELVSDRIAAIRREHGPDALAVYLGNPNVHSLGSMTHGIAMVKMLRTRNRYSATSVDQLPHQLVNMLMFGHQLLQPVADLDRTDYFLVFGANPMASNGSMMTVPAFPQRLRELKARGGRMVVVDPRRTETAKVASEHHFIRPGSDAAVLLAMVRTLFEEGLTRPAAWVDGIEDVREAVAPFTPELAERASGIAAADIRRLARDFAGAPAAAAYGRVGLSTQAFGTVCQWAVQLLNVLTGNLDRVGGAMFTRPAVDAVGRRLLGPGHHDRYRSRVRGLPEFSGELPVATLADEILTRGRGQVRALLTVAGNPVLSSPGGARLDAALAGLDFMAAVDFYLNETTRHADVILPPTTALERDHYDLAFHTLAVRNTARFTPALFAKKPDARDDWQIFAEIALRTTKKESSTGGPWRRLTALARLRLSPTRTVDLLLRTGDRRLSVRALRRSPDGVDLGPLRPCLPGRLQTPDHRVKAAPDLVLGDLPRLLAELQAQQGRAGSGELLLIGRRHQRDNNSWMHNTTRLTRGRPRHQLYMHPDDAHSRGLTDGDLVRVTSRMGVVEVEMRATDEVMPGVVSMPHGYGHDRDGVRLQVASGVPGASINDLTDPERLDTPSGTAAFSGLPVTVSRAAGAPAPEAGRVATAGPS
jgi:anaerobic selenocysteine-containing dehydrogenase